MEEKEFFTLDDFEFSGKTVAIRVDFNSAYNEETKMIEDNIRFEASVETVKELLEKNARVILLAHQGRKGEKDFISLKQHAEIFSVHLGKEVKFVDDIIGEKAKKEIESLKSGEVLLLDNVRFLEDETMKKSPEEHVNSSLVKFLSPFIDYYVLDAFSVAHRSHSSIVGFALVKPMIAGRLMEKEILSKEEALKSLGINTWIMGGAKIDDCIEVLEFMFENKPEAIERVLTGGMFANLFFLAQGLEIGSKSFLLLEKKGHLQLLEKAKNLIAEYSKEIILPEDVAIEKNGKRKEVKIEKIPKDAMIMDIGKRTIEKYEEIIKGSRTIIFKGPLGVYEKKGFEVGTKKILEAVAKSDAFSLVGGGDTGLAIEKLGIDESKFSHVSVGGGALITFLSGKPMPGIEALKLSYKKFGLRVNE